MAERAGMFAPLPHAAAARAGDRRAEVRPKAWAAILPVPADAPARPSAHGKHGRPSRTETYRSAAGEVLGYVLRFDLAAGKQFSQLVYAANAATGARGWHWQGFPAPRPLYGLDRLAARPGAPVIVCEGEKAADAAERLLPDHVAVTSPGGAKAAGKADWTSLRGRKIRIWPDKDQPGAAFAASVARILRQVSPAELVLIEPPASAADGWDAADALAEGWDEAQA